MTRPCLKQLSWVGCNIGNRRTFVAASSSLKLPAARLCFRLLSTNLQDCNIPFGRRLIFKYMTSDDVMFDDINLYERLVCQTYLRLWNGDITRRVATSLLAAHFAAPSNVLHYQCKQCDCTTQFFYKPQHLVSSSSGNDSTTA